ncbi:hypothetical protein [Pseudonocardia sp. TRM90224]|uniref:hypothetical protein n=1 Tax=Pseudonocardia sp. TRM90224 TaxID=2812678 RepID=UPI001E2ADF96|nr:hypothetical protein [Pseudonocardia sp. TRM90224]
MQVARLLAGLALASALLVACADPRGDVDAVTAALRATPGVGSAESSYGEPTIKHNGDLRFEVDVVAGAAPDDVVAIVRNGLAGLRADSLVALRGSLELRTPAGARLTVAGVPPEVPPEVIEAATRSWMALTAAYPAAEVVVGNGGGQPAEIDLSGDLPLGWPPPPQGVVEAFAAIENARFPEAATGMWRVGAGEPVDERHSARWSARTGEGKAVPPAAVQETMVALQAVLAGQGESTLELLWNDFPGQGYLDVTADIGAEEFRKTPGNQINSLIAGSVPERLATELTSRLDASGVPYTISASVFDNDPFLVVERR